VEVTLIQESLAGMAAQGYEQGATSVDRCAIFQADSYAGTIADAQGAPHQAAKIM
jgi:hypothetical protein